jgi:hypothetical protein
MIIHIFFLYEHFHIILRLLIIGEMSAAAINKTIEKDSYFLKCVQ